MATPDFAPLSQLPIVPGTPLLRPPASAAQVVHLNLDSPAREAMTDFNIVAPLTVRRNVAIDAALEYMKTSGVRLLLVSDDDATLSGLVSSYDIQGEQPIKLVQDSGIARADITVAQVMTSLPQVQAIDMLSVRGARLGAVVATLRAIGQRHVLVVQMGKSETERQASPDTLPAFAVRDWAAADPRTDRARDPWIRGLFSAAHISRLLGRSLAEVIPAAESLAELNHALGG